MKRVTISFIAFSIIVLGIVFASCAGSGNSTNALDQALPTIMVIPSDRVLEQSGCASVVNINGNTVIVRDYQKFMMANTEHRTIVSQIQNKFNDKNFPLVDLEQSLKNLNTKAAHSAADDIQTDVKTELLQTCQPDIIIEFDYATSGIDMTSHSYKKSVSSVTVTALDAYTSKAVAAHSVQNPSGSSLAEMVVDGVDEHLSSLTADISKYFADIVENGREVTLRFVVKNGANIKLSDANIEGDTYTDWFIDYVKANTVKGAYNMRINSDSELSFTNVRIPLQASDGTQYGSYDWVRDCTKIMRKQLGLNCTNATQGLGDMVIIINGY